MKNFSMVFKGFNGKFRKKLIFLAVFLAITPLIFNPLLVLAVPPSYSTSGPNSPTGVVDSSFVGSRSWSSPQNATSTDGRETSVSLYSDAARSQSHYLKASDFGFAIPSDATINGIFVSVVRHKADVNSFIVSDKSLVLSLNGTATSTDDKAKSAAWSKTSTEVTYGGSGDLWGSSWTPADINNKKFSVLLSVERKDNSDTTYHYVYVDSVMVKIYYTPAPASTLTVNLVTNPTSDGGVFDVGVDGTTMSGGTNLSNGQSVGPLALTSGAHTVSVSAGSGTNMADYITTFSGDCGLSGSLYISSGQNAVCTITNTRKGKIIVHKIVLPPEGSEVYDDTNFTIDFSQDESKNSINQYNPVSFSGLAPGTYTILEETNPNYDFVSYSTDLDSDLSGAQVSVGAGESVDLNITNRQKPSTLTVITEVVNHGIGSAVPSDFTIKVTGNAVSTPSFSGVSSPGVTVNLSPGDYSVKETGLSNYSLTDNGNCSGHLYSNGTLPTCIFTMSDIYPAEDGAITVVNNVDNKNGGVKTASDFALTITPLDSTDPPISVSSGVPNVLAPGNYKIDETVLSGYKMSSVICTDGSGIQISDNGTVNLSVQTAITCTISTDNIPPKLTLIKKVINDNGGQASVEDWLLKAVGPTSISGVGNVSSDDNFKVGSYKLSEESENATLSSKYSGSFACSGAEISDGLVNMDLGQEVVCTFTNDDKPATLKVTKNTGDFRGGPFDFVVSNSTSENVKPIKFSITTSLSSQASYEPININAGTYDITESVLDGWSFSKASCSLNEKSIGSDISLGQKISVQNGDSVSCTFNNVKNPVQESGGGSPGGNGKPPEMIGDINRDRKVDMQDIALLMSFWGQSGQSGQNRADLNGDGLVDMLDLSLLMGNWNE